MIARVLQKFKSELPSSITLIAVSKTKPIDAIKEAYDAQQLDFGENKVQELIEKYELLPKDIRWHMIGHLQTNKVKFIVPFIHLIHGVDSIKLLQEINKQSIKIGRKTNTLLQYYIATEETKYGLSQSELEEIIARKEEFTHINFCGLMGMASYTSNSNIVHTEFTNLYNLYNKLHTNNTFGPNFQTLSMGMSGDYKIAINCGSTMIRIGSALFGTR